MTSKSDGFSLLNQKFPFQAKASAPESSLEASGYNMSVLCVCREEPITPVLQEDIFPYFSRMLQGESARTRQTGQRTDDCYWVQTHSFSFNILIHMYMKCSRLECAGKVFDRMSERNHGSWNAMIFGYSVNNKMGLAKSLFDLMPERDVVSWTSLISGYLQNENCLKSVEVFVMMGREGVANNVVTFVVVLKACAGLEDCVLGLQLHGAVVKLGFESDVVAGNAVLDMYAKCKMLDESLCFFDAMPVQDWVSWSAIIAGCVQNNDLKGGLELFKEMQREGVGVSQSVYAIVFRSCAGLSDLRLGSQLHGYALKNDFGADTIVGTAMLDMYAKCDNLLSATKVFNLLPNHNLHSYTALIVGYARVDHGFEGMQLFMLLLKSDLGFDEISLSAAFSACSMSQGLRVGSQIHGLAVKTPFHYSVFVATAIVDMYGKCGALSEASRMFDKMESRDDVSWNAIISIYSSNEQSEGAQKYSSRMLEMGIKPDSITYATVLDTCSNVANVGLGRQIHAQVIKQELQSNVYIVSKLVPMYSKCGNMHDSVLMFERSSKRELATWNAMVCAYASHGFGNSTAYVLLSNIYADAEMWNEASKMRRIMKSSRVKKKPGCSWIEVQGEVHVFLVGDEAHPRCDEIYESLDLLMAEKKLNELSTSNHVMLGEDQELCAGFS